MHNLRDIHAELIVRWRRHQFFFHANRFSFGGRFLTDHRFSFDHLEIIIRYGIVIIWH